MSTMGGKVAVVGIGHSRILRRAYEPLGKLAVEAVTNAIADAGLKMSDIDGVSACPVQPFELGEAESDGINHVSPAFMVRALKLDACWVERTWGRVGHSIIEAVNAVGNGMCRYAVAFRALYNPVGRRYGHINPATLEGQDQFFGPYGMFAPASFALLYKRYMHKYGAKREQMAAFIVRNRDYALKFPYGYWYQHGGKPLTIDEYMTSRMISDPICIHDCDIPISGCAAFVVTTSERAKDLPHHPAYVLGACGTGTIGLMSRTRTLESYIEAGKYNARHLWRNSGVSPKDVDVLNAYDGFSIETPLWVEGLGFCGEGEAFSFIANPPIPLNTSAGNLGSGRLHGTPHFVDSILQVMGRSGARQVKDAEITVGVGMPTPGESIVFGRNPS
jgi:acetyl-CoA acetyltransferase